MTRDEIYDHLAQVYLGKREKAKEVKKQQFNVWLVINIVITVVIFASAFYGLTAFLARRGEGLHHSVIFALNNGPLRIQYDFHEPFPPVKTFSLTIPKVNAAKYENLSFSIRGGEQGYPGIVKIVIKNQKNEVASYHVNNVKVKWQKVSIPLAEFKQITDWTNLTDVSFIFEAWNIEKKKGMVLIDDVCFSS